MKTLNERFADRAARKAENAVDAGTIDTTGNDHLKEAVEAIFTANTALDGLSDEDKQEVMYRVENGGTPSEGYVPVEGAARPYAGIGLVNPFQMPAMQSGNGGGIGADGAFVENVSPDEIAAAQQQAAADAASASTAWGFGAQTGNLNGAAIEQAAQDAGTMTGGNGADTIEGGGGDQYDNMTVAQLKADLDGRTPPVKYETDANKARLQELARA